MKKLLVASFLFAGMLSLFAASVAETPVSGFQVKEKHREWWEPRYKMIKKQAEKGGKKIQLVFLGDSITHFLGNKKYQEVWDQFSYCNPLNVGFSGDRTQHTIWLVEQSGIFDKLSPKLIVVLIGTNNYGWRNKFPPEQTSRAIARIVSSLRKKCPNAKILLFGIFPRDEKPATEKRLINAKVNASICKLADGKNVFYEDIADKFLREDGTLPKSLFPDFLHPNKEGYKIWFDAIRPYVNKYIGPAQKKKEIKK